MTLGPEEVVNTTKFDHPTVLPLKLHELLDMEVPVTPINGYDSLNGCDRAQMVYDVCSKNCLSHFLLEKIESDGKNWSPTVPKGTLNRIFQKQQR